MRVVSSRDGAVRAKAADLSRIVRDHLSEMSCAILKYAYVACSLFSYAQEIQPRPEGLRNYIRQTHARGAVLARGAFALFLQYSAQERILLLLVIIM